jgi:class 3 adenylate cyclase
VIKSLEQRFALFLLLPVALLLFLTGFLGWLYARNIMLQEWREAAVLKLQRAAHQLDMRLRRPMDWIQMMQAAAGGRGGFFIQDWILDSLRGMDGVTRVDLRWLDERTEPLAPGMYGHGRGMRFHRARVLRVTSPHLDAQSGKEAVDILTELRDEAGTVVGRIEISIRFDHLMQDITRLGWWQSDRACLVDESGQYIAHTREMEGRHQLGETGDLLEMALLQDMKEKPFGTRLGPGRPPGLVAGFHKITQAPWAIVMFAPGEKILGPIIKFRLYYFLAVGLCVLLILILIHLVGGGLVRSIRELSAAAKRVAGGDYGEPLQARTSDEMGQLIQGFNAMVEGLRNRDFIRNTFGRYVDQEFAREILNRPEAARLGGEKRAVAVLMSDIRGFTALADSLKPEGTILILIHFFTHMVRPVQKHKGVIIDFFGDGLLVFFDPLEGPVVPVLRNAVRCALDMQSDMELFNAELEAKGLPQFQMGIGIHAGEVVVGNIGTDYRAKYGIVGTPVNLTERIQSQAGGGEVVVSDAVREPLAAELIIRRSLSARLKGIREEIPLHVVQGLK